MTIVAVAVAVVPNPTTFGKKGFKSAPLPPVEIPVVGIPITKEVEDPTYPWPPFTIDNELIVPAAETIAVIAAATTLPDGIIRPSALLELIIPSSLKNWALSTDISVSPGATSAIILDVG